MTGLYNLTRRNCKLFFKDKGMFFSAMITPIILLVLYATFLARVYRNSFVSVLPAGMPDMGDIIDATVGGQLISSLLAVSCITVAFCCNLICVQDKARGTVNDLYMTPAGRGCISLGYYLATVLSTLLVCFGAAGVGFIYLHFAGSYISASDVLLILFDIFLLVMFGTALSSIVNLFISTEGQMSAVGTIVSAGYGFICGAYMPMSQFSEGLRNVLMFLPGTYGTSLIRSHYLRGAFAEMSDTGFPDDVVEGIKGSIDCTLSFFGRDVSTGAMYAVLAGSVVLLIAVFVLLSKLKVGKRA